MVRYKAGRTTFEIMCHPSAVAKFRKGECTLEETIVSDVVYKGPARKGERANAAELESAFETSDMRAVLDTILQRGTAQVSADERREQLETKRRQVINHIRKNYINPRTGLPCTLEQIEDAVGQLKALTIDPSKPADMQATEIARRIIDEVMPLKKSEMGGVLTIPHRHLGSAMGIVHQWASVRKEDYNSEGVVMEIGFSAGDFDRIMSELNRVTKGEYQVRVRACARVTCLPCVAEKCFPLVFMCVRVRECVRALADMAVFAQFDSETAKVAAAQAAGGKGKKGKRK